MAKIVYNCGLSECNRVKHWASHIRRKLLCTATDFVETMKLNVSWSMKSWLTKIKCWDIKYMYHDNLLSSIRKLIIHIPLCLSVRKNRKSYCCHPSIGLSFHISIRIRLFCLKFYIWWARGCLATCSVRGQVLCWISSRSCKPCFPDAA